MPQTDPQLLAHARLMRANMPQPKRKLWSELRAERFQSTKFARQVVIGSYIGDFVCRSRKLIIEIDGHSHADAAADERRTLDLEVLGYRVIRFSNYDVMTNTEGVLAAIGEALHTSPLPTLSPEGRGL